MRKDKESFSSFASGMPNLPPILRKAVESILTEAFGRISGAFQAQFGNLANAIHELQVHQNDAAVLVNVIVQILAEKGILDVERLGEKMKVVKQEMLDLEKRGEDISKEKPRGESSPEPVAPADGSGTGG